MRNDKVRELESKLAYYKQKYYELLAEKEKNFEEIKIVKRRKKQLARALRRRAQIVEAIEEGRFFLREILAFTSIPRATLKRDLREMIEEKWIRRVGVNKYLLRK